MSKSYDFELGVKVIFPEGAAQYVKDPQVTVKSHNITGLATKLSSLSPEQRSILTEYVNVVLRLASAATSKQYKKNMLTPTGEIHELGSSTAKSDLNRLTKDRYTWDVSVLESD
jgi:hypothetical protein